MTTTMADPGDNVNIAGTWTASGTITSVTVTATIRLPDGTTDDLAVVSDVVTPVVTATATYLIPTDNSWAGWHYVRWSVTGDLVAADEDAFFVRRSEVLA